MEKGNIFQMALLAILGLAIIVAVLIFSGLIPGFSGNSSEFGGQVTVWGVFPRNKIENLVNDLNRSYNKEFEVIYEYHSPESIENDYLQARARGGAPDLLLASDSLINRYRNTFFKIPFSSYSLRTFKDTFIEGAEIFLGPEEVVAVPMVVDPLVLFYNRDLLTSSGIINPPKTWSDVLVQIPKVNQVGVNNSINQSLIAMGEFGNIRNAKAIFETLLFQAGNPIVTLNTDTGSLENVFGRSLGFNQNPAVAASDFFSQFAVFNKSVYSWNPSLLEDRRFFGAGKLATYFGFSSELDDIKDLNPNLNLDVTVVPQRNETDKKVTRADFYGVAIVNNSANLNTAFKVAFILTNSVNSRAWAESLSLPSARRDVLSLGSSNPFNAVFNDSALISRSWFDPNPEQTKDVFARLIKKIVSGQNSAQIGVSLADTEILNLLK